MAESWKHKLLDMDPCSDGLLYALPWRTPQSAWEYCDNGEWMMWLLDKVDSRKAELIPLVKKWILHCATLSEEARDMLIDHENLTTFKICDICVSHGHNVLYDFYYFLEGSGLPLASLGEAIADAMILNNCGLTRKDAVNDLAQVIHGDIPRIMEWLDISP